MSRREHPGQHARLLATARALFSQRGFDATSTREIAAQAGCNLSLINYYFGSKEGLLAGILKAEMEEGAPDLLDALRAPGSAADQLRLFIDRAIDHFAEDGDFLRIAHREIMQRGSRFLDTLIVPIAGMIDELAQRFAEVQHQAPPDKLDPRMTALLLVGTMQFYFLAYPLTSKLVGPLSDSLKAELKRHVVAAFLGRSGPRAKLTRPEPGSSQRAKRPEKSSKRLRTKTPVSANGDPE